MSKHWVSVSAVCPYYKHEVSQVIHCYGPVPGSVLHLAFASKTDALEYKRAYCRRGYDLCPIARMLTEEGIDVEQN